MSVLRSFSRMVHDRKSRTSLKREETLSLKSVRGLGPIQILKIAVRAPVAPNVLSLSLPPVWRPQKPHPGGIGQAPEYRSDQKIKIRDFTKTLEIPICISQITTDHIQVRPLSFKNGINFLESRIWTNTQHFRRIAPALKSVLYDNFKNLSQ